MSPDDRTPADPPQGDQTEPGLPDRVEQLPAWREPPRPPEIPEVLRKPVDRPRPVSNGGSALSGMGELGKALAIGLDFLFTIGAAGLLGYLLDRWQGWSPYGLLIGLAVGFLAATVRIIQRSNREDALSRRGGRNG